MVARQRKSCIDRVKDPAGRLDCLLARLMDRVAEMRLDPQLVEVYRQLAPDLHREINARFGPRTKPGKVAQELVRRMQPATPATAATGVRGRGRVGI